MNREESTKKAHDDLCKVMQEWEDMKLEPALGLYVGLSFFLEAIFHMAPCRHEIHSILAESFMRSKYRTTDPDTCTKCQEPQSESEQ